MILSFKEILEIDEPIKMTLIIKKTDFMSVILFY